MTLIETFETKCQYKKITMGIIISKAEYKLKVISNIPYPNTIFWYIWYTIGFNENNKSRTFMLRIAASHEYIFNDSLVNLFCKLKFISFIFILSILTIFICSTYIIF